MAHSVTKRRRRVLYVCPVLTRYTHWLCDRRRRRRTYTVTSCTLLFTSSSTQRDEAKWLNPLVTVKIKMNPSWRKSIFSAEQRIRRNPLRVHFSICCRGMRDYFSRVFSRDVKVKVSVSYRIAVRVESRIEPLYWSYARMRIYDTFPAFATTSCVMHILVLA